MSKFKMVFVSVLTVLSLSWGTGCIAPFAPPATSTGTAVAPEVALASVDQAWDIIQGDYVDKSKIDNSKLSGAAITAMLETLNDPYTTYLDAESYRLTLTSMQGTFDGIGATLNGENNTAKIVAVQPDSPAEQAGVKPGDIIRAVDGVSTEGMSLTEVIARVRGPRGSSVKLTLEREGEPGPIEITIVRAAIKIVSVTSKMQDGIAVIEINSFAETTDQELKTVLSGLPGQNATGIILDLRDNPGGLLQSVVDIASHFLKPGDLVVDVVDNKGRRESSKAGQTDVTSDLPIVVLVNENSASGSEVLSGALRDHNRATIAGTKTFGKGSVNILRQLTDGSGIYITIARWYTPSGQLIEGKGIEPQVPLDLTGDEEVNWAIDYLKSSGASTPPATPKTTFRDLNGPVYG